MLSVKLDPAASDTHQDQCFQQTPQQYRMSEVCHVLEIQSDVGEVTVVVSSSISSLNLWLPHFSRQHPLSMLVSGFPQIWSPLHCDTAFSDTF